MPDKFSSARGDIMYAMQHAQTNQERVMAHCASAIVEAIAAAAKQDEGKYYSGPLIAGDDTYVGPYGESAGPYS